MKEQGGARIRSELLEDAFCGAAAHLTHEQTATEFPGERTRQWWGALGSVDPDPDEIRFTESDVAAAAVRAAALRRADRCGIAESVARTVGQPTSPSVIRRKT